MPDAIKPILIFTWGNPSRGDDALGPRMYDLLIENALPDVEVLTDFQLQIEHTVDMERRGRIIFIDASLSADAPFEFYRLDPRQDDSYTTHAMSPQSLLATYQKVYGTEPAPAFMLSIRGYTFDLGLPVSDAAAANLAQAFSFLTQLIADNRIQAWSKLTSR